MSPEPESNNPKDSAPSKSAAEWLEEGIEQMREKKDYEARISFQNVVELDPHNAKAWFHLGFVSANLYYKADAMKYYRKALELDPQDYEAWYNLGNEYLDLKDPLFDDPWEDEQGDYPAAIQCYEKALEIDPEFSFAWNNMGYSYFSLKQYQKAVECHQKAVDLDANNDSAWVNLGNAYYFLKDYDKSIKVYEKVTESHPANNQGWICLRAALESYLLRVELTDNNKEMRLIVARNFLRLGQETKAIACLKSLLALDCHYFAAWHWLGRAYHKLNNHEKFMEHFTPLHDLLKQIQRISIITTSQGPLYPDVFWLLEANEDIGIIPSEGPAENILPLFQVLPGFNNEEVIKAMTSTEDDIFIVWEQKDDSIAEPRS